MTKKERFIYAKSEGGTGYAIYDTTKNYTFPNLPREYEATVLCRVLNELADENEELKKENKELQLTKNFWKEQCNHRINEYKNYYSINHCPCSADDFVHELKKIYTQSIKEKGQLKQENEGLKQQLADIDKLIYDLGHNKMQRQYEEITKENGEK